MEGGWDSETLLSRVLGVPAEDTWEQILPHPTLHCRRISSALGLSIDKFPRVRGSAPPSLLVPTCCSGCLSHSQLHRGQGGERDTALHPFHLSLLQPEAFQFP